MTVSGLLLASTVGLLVVQACATIRPYHEQNPSVPYDEIVRKLYFLKEIPEFSVGASLQDQGSIVVLDLRFRNKTDHTILIDPFRISLISASHHVEAKRLGYPTWNIHEDRKAEPDELLSLAPKSTMDVQIIFDIGMLTKVPPWSRTDEAQNLKLQIAVVKSDQKLLPEIQYDMTLRK